MPGRKYFFEESLQVVIVALAIICTERCFGASEKKAFPRHGKYPFGPNDKAITVHANIGTVPGKN